MSYTLFSLLLQESSESLVEQETSLPPDEHMKQQEQEDLDEEEYEFEDADIIREASTLDDLAKLITVEEVCTSSFLGLSCFSCPLNPLCPTELLPVDKLFSVLKMCLIRFTILCSFSSPRYLDAGFVCGYSQFYKS